MPLCRPAAQAAGRDRGGCRRWPLLNFNGIPRTRLREGQQADLCSGEVGGADFWSRSPETDAGEGVRL